VCQSPQSLFPCDWAIDRSGEKVNTLLRNCSLNNVMGIKDTIENHPAVFFFGVLAAGFGSGVGAVSYLDARDEKLREEIIEELRLDNENLSQQNEILNVRYTEAELVGRAMSSLLTVYVWIERDESPDKVIPQFDSAIDNLRKSKAVTSITSLTSARASYQRASKGEVQRKLDDAIVQIKEQISR